jgi:phosphopantetheine--protein transferase-like protein
MIIGSGIDTIEIDRFSQWHTYSRQKLRRIFSPEEIDYCLANPQKSAERFAVRFAAREAFYKALSYAYPDYNFPFLTVCSHTAIHKINQRPYYKMVNFGSIDSALFTIHLSWSHSRLHATAFVIIEQQ